jgi:hypothetical protein
VRSRRDDLLLGGARSPPPPSSASNDTNPRWRGAQSPGRAQWRPSVLAQIRPVVSRIELNLPQHDVVQTTRSNVGSGIGSSPFLLPPPIAPKHIRPLPFSPSCCRTAAVASRLAPTADKG